MIFKGYEVFPILFFFLGKLTKYNVIRLFPRNFPNFPFISLFFSIFYFIFFFFKIQLDIGHNGNKWEIFGFYLFFDNSYQFLN